MEVRDSRFGIFLKPGHKRRVPSRRCGILWTRTSSLLENVWLLQELRAPEIYSARYLRFFADVDEADLAVHRYEDFGSDPDRRLRRMTGELNLEFLHGFRDRIASIVLTGDSERSSADIGPWQRRSPSRRLLRQIRRELDSPSYVELATGWGTGPASTMRRSSERGSVGCGVQHRAASRTPTVTGAMRTSLRCGGEGSIRPGATAARHAVGVVREDER